MPDEFDRASEHEQRLRDDALRRQGLRARLGDADDWERISALHCVNEGCGVEIPEARRKALPGVLFCVDCQQQSEKRKNR